MPPAGATPSQEAGGGDEPAPLDVYTATVSSEQAAELSNEGLDIISTQRSGTDVTVDAVLDATDRNRVEERTGVDLELKRNGEGQTARQMATLQAASGFDVWRSYDEPGGIRDELYQVARENRGLVKLEVLGHTGQGREIIALKVTKDARSVRDGRRPAVFYNSNQHAREWISVEVNRRTLHYFLDQYKAGNHEIRRILGDTELWFVLSANPDGYQYTFDHERMWRKNLRDNDGDGVITRGDGVDPNRNFDEHWNYDNEGSSTEFASDTYRGPGPASEPETQATQGLIDRIKPKFMSNFHSFANQLLFPQGWQIGTPDADNPIYTAIGGTDANPGMEGFDPGISSDELYVTNGETTDYADVNAGTVAITPELGEGTPGSGFVFPDDEGLIQAEFENTLDFSLSMARSAKDPDDPTSATGITTKPFYLDQTEVDAENGPLSMFDFTFTKSYGDPQEVRVLAKRSLGAVTAKYQINGGRIQSTSTREWKQGETYGVGKGTYYHVMAGTIRGTRPGDTVKVWFEGGHKRSGAFTYTAVKETRNKVLVMAAEDYTGASPVYADQTKPTYLSYYTDALTANHVGFDVYDVDANGRVAPDALGVLSHYDAVVWYTGDDIITREAGWAGGNASSLAITEAFEVRDFVNEGGRAMLAGKYAGFQYYQAQNYDPFENAQCSSDPAILARCRPLNGSGDFNGDVMEYWFGASIANDDAGTDPETGGLFDVLGVDIPFTGAHWTFNGADSAQNQDHSLSYITTSGLLPVADYPQFDSWVSGRYDRPGGPFEPHSGSQYVYSGISDISYKRLTQTIDVPAGGGNLSFWVSHDTEEEWDHFFVEAHHPGQDDWTTLPDLNGHTTDNVGQSCPAGWRDLHPQLDHYQTYDAAAGTCTPTGTTGSWNAASGPSGGWQQWNVDLSAYAGGQVEISLAYVSDWSTQGLGVFLDDIAVSTGQGTTDFEADLGGWTVPGPPAGSTPNPTDFARITGAGFPEGAVVATDDTLLFGFGLEGVTGAATRNAIMGDAVRYLLRRR
ncbi:MAG TPA: M14 family zinc carboxypeptidase [Acidimicrobiales bacterium]|nr:M14 family zinc carboxypeptidase [Acidimicrobiales bacterium]